MAFEVAQISLATGIGPADLLAAPPEVYAAIVQILDEQSRQARRNDLRERLRASVKG